MPEAGASGRPFGVQDAPALIRLSVSAAIGIAVAVVMIVLGAGKLTALLGWDAAAMVFLGWMWATIGRLDADQTANRALRQDPGRLATDVVVLSASVASLAAVGLVLVHAGNTKGATKELLIGLGILSVMLAWSVVHTLFTLHYARLYYLDPEGGIDFNEESRPRYIDFAYVAFTVGMTFQVSDTDLKTKDVRGAVLRHAGISYVFGAVIIATTINLIAGLTK
jgi:uncharacterized membrane protein